MLKDKLQQADNLLREVSTMRNMQEEYFKNRDYNHLKKTKVQEKKVDAMIKDYFQRQHRLKFGIPD